MAIQQGGAGIPRRRDGVLQEPQSQRTAPLLQSRKDRVLSQTRHRPAHRSKPSVLEGTDHTHIIFFHFEIVRLVVVFRNLRS